MHPTTAVPSDSPSLVPSSSLLPSFSPSIVQTVFIDSRVRKIRIVSFEGEAILLYNVEAFSSDINVATEGVATQSFDYSNVHPALNAIDGNDTSFSLTKGLDAYWEVDLGGLFLIESVVLTISYMDSRIRMLIDGGYTGLESLYSEDSSCRLSNGTVTLLDDEDSVVESQSLNDTCGHSTIQLSFNPTTSFSRVSTSEGWCLDSYGKYYSYVRRSDASVNLTANDCATWCMQNPAHLIAFDFYSDPSGEVNKCYCTFNDGIPTVIGTYNPPHSKLSLGEVGLGPITAVSGDSDWFCYQNDVSECVALIYFSVIHDHELWSPMNCLPNACLMSLYCCCRTISLRVGAPVIQTVILLVVFRVLVYQAVAPIFCRTNAVATLSVT